MELDAKTVAISHALREVRFEPEDLEKVLNQFFDLAWHAGYWAAVKEIGVSIGT